MKHIIRTTAFTLILASSILAFEAKADRQGGGTLITAGRVSIDKWIDFDARLAPAVIPDLNLSDFTAKPVSEFVRFKSAQGDQVTFDYTWINGNNAAAGQVTLNKAQLSDEGADVVKALLESRGSSQWSLVR
jgi:hypothetical protein